MQSKSRLLIESSVEHQSTFDAGVANVFDLTEKGQKR